MRTCHQSSFNYNLRRLLINHSWKYCFKLERGFKSYLKEWNVYWPRRRRRAKGIAIAHMHFEALRGKTVNKKKKYNNILEHSLHNDSQLTFISVHITILIVDPSYLINGRYTHFCLR